MSDSPEEEVGRKPGESCEAKVIFIIQGLEKGLLDAGYPNLKMVGNIVSALGREHLDAGFKPRPVVPDLKMDAPPEELRTYMAEWLVRDLERLGRQDVVTEINEAALRYSTLVGTAGVGNMAEADSWIAKEMANMQLLGQKVPAGESADPNVLVMEAAKVTAETAGPGVDKQALARNLESVTFGLVSLLRKGNWWEQILANPTP